MRSRSKPSRASGLIAARDGNVLHARLDVPALPVSLGRSLAALRQLIRRDLPTDTSAEPKLLVLPAQTERDRP